MPSCNMIKYATKVGLNNMSKGDLKELMIQIDILKCENMNGLEKYGYCVEIEKKLKAITKAISDVLHGNDDDFDEWGLKMDQQEINQLKYELKFFCKLYAKYSSAGDIEGADKVRRIMDNIEQTLNKKAVKVILTATADRMS